MHGRARGGKEGDDSSGVELTHRRGLARFARRFALSAASCDAEHVAVRRAYVRHDYAFTPLPLPLYLVPDCSRLHALLPHLLVSLPNHLRSPSFPGFTFFARFHFASPPRPRRLLSLSELLTFPPCPPYRRHFQ